MQFKTVKYTDGKDGSHPEDEEVEPSVTVEEEEALGRQREGSVGKKHVRIQIDEHAHSGEHPDDKVGLLPSFERRPLSDTPVTSTWNSPDSTPSGSRESSSTNLLRLNTHINSNTELDTLSRVSTNESNSDFSGISSPSRFQHPKKRPTTLDVPGLTKSKTSPDGTISTEDPGSKLVIIMVGLPATGKSFITNKLSRYLNYSMYYCKAFNVGNTRRQYAKEHNLKDQDSKFFDPNNEEFTKLRDEWALDTLNQLLDYLLDGPGSVGIFDATNTTKERRKHILGKIRERNQYLEVLFLETICSDKAVVEKNIHLKLSGPDYKGKDPNASLLDFKERLLNYTKAYEPIEDDEEIQYIKMIDVGKKVISYKIKGFLASQTVYYLLNFTLAERQIWITRNGESEYNVKGRIGGDSHLTARGKKYSMALAKFISQQRELFHENELKKLKEASPKETDENHQCNEFFVWTSSRIRCVETANSFNEIDYPTKQMKMLDELNAGDCEGMTYAEIKMKYPEGYAERQRDKIRYRYPGIGGESYMDVINRVRPVITEIERIEDNVLIITHRVVARVLLGYFLNLSKDIIANLDIPLHCVYCLEPKPYGITWSLWEYNEEKDEFFKVPQSVMNTTKVKEVSLVYKERRYSIIPTAPSHSDRSKANKNMRKSLKKTIAGDPSHSKASLSGLIHEFKARSASNNNKVTPIKSPKDQFEVDKLDEKLASLKSTFSDEEDNDDADDADVSGNRI